MKAKLLVVAVAAAFAPLSAFATDGYFAHGFGVKSQGMGGVGVALPQDALAAATNPAGMALIGDRLDVGLTWFRPIRGAEISGTPGGFSDGSFDGSGKKNFFIPEFGINKMVSPDFAVGVSVFGNGGLNTQYDGGIPLFGQGKAGVDLMQLFVSPTMAYKITPNHSIGVSLNLVYQRFKADGLQNFTTATEHPDGLTNNGYDSARGWGARIGWMGEVLPGLTLGATYSSKTKMTSFSKYKGLFVEQGESAAAELAEQTARQEGGESENEGVFDIPENYAIGAAWKPMPALTIAADVLWINYNKVNALGHEFARFTSGGQPLGGVAGPGFGWRDMTVYKIGASYDVSSNLTLRAGYNYGRQPIPSSEVLFNILAPGVVEQHATLGATWRIDPKQEVSFAYMHAFKKTVDGPGAIPGGLFVPPGTPPSQFPPNANASIHMYQDSLGIAYGYKF